MHNQDSLMEESKTTYVKRGTAVFGVVGAHAVKLLALETLNAGASITEDAQENIKKTTVTSKFHQSSSIPR